MKRATTIRLLAALLTLVMVCSLLPALASAAPAEEKSPYRLWYDEPAENSYNGWECRSLPIGNGAIGGNIFGRYDTERLTLNEKSFWTGGPSDSRPNYMGGNNAAKGQNGAAMKQVQDLFLAGKTAEATALCNQYLVGDSAGYGGYQLFGNLYLELGHSDVTNYVRDLDLMTGVATVEYDAGGTHYAREYFTSYPDNVLVIHLTAEGRQDLDFSVYMAPENTGSATRSAAITGSDTELVMAGALNDNQLKYNGTLQVQVSGENAASVKSGDKLVISDASEVTILLSMATDYENDYPAYRTGETDGALADRVKAVVDAAAGKTYEELRSTHVADVDRLMGRVTVELGQSDPGLTTDELLDAYNKDALTRNQRTHLEMLTYQFGRYLLVGSSRGDVLPANLQGLWVGKNDNSWSSDYHLNVNLQMNYWPAYVGNLAECALPMIDYIDSLREPGRVTAQVYFGVESTEENPENGFSAHTQNTPFGWTCPGWSFSWGWSPAAVPWMLQNVWEYYEFTSDEDFLAQTIYPIMKEEVKFYLQIMRQDENGKWISTPAYSPEHGPYTNGNTYEQSLIWQLLTDTITAGEIVGEDPEVLAQWQTVLNDLRTPIEVGTSGQVKEWYHETSLNSVTGGASGHRHISHLLGLYPGDLITEETPEWFEAARVSLEDRVDMSTGWAMGQRLNSWARLREGDRAHALMEMQLTRTGATAVNYSQGGGTYDNLFCAHPPFQIDGNFGYTAGVNEMLLQSHTGKIVPLAALPSAWSTGSFSGLVARGNFETDAVWQGGNLVSFTVRSGDGNDCVVSYPGITGAAVTCDGKAVAVTAVDAQTISFATEAGREYVISSIPHEKLSSVDNIQAVRRDSTVVELTWDAVDGAERYHVYRSRNGGAMERIVYATPETAYTDRTALMEAAGDTVSYLVTAVSAKGVEGREAVPAEALSAVEGGTVAITAPGGVTLLREKGEEIRLCAETEPAAPVTWRITNAEGQPTILAEVDQNGVVTATGIPGSGTVLVTAETLWGKDQFALSVSIGGSNGENLLAGRPVTLTKGNRYSASSYGPEYLTDGYTGGSANGGNRLALNNGSEAWLEIELESPSRIGSLEVYERTDNSWGDPYRIDEIGLMASDDGQSWRQVPVGEISHQSIHNNVEHWIVEGVEMEQPAKYLRFVLKDAQSQQMTVWELEAYAAGDKNLFLDGTFALESGYNTIGSRGPAFLNDGFCGTANNANADARLAMSNYKEVPLRLTMPEARIINTVDIYERMDYSWGDSVRIDQVEIQASYDGGQTWQTVGVGGEEWVMVNNYVGYRRISGIEMAQPTQDLRLLLKDNDGAQMTLWEIEGYQLTENRGRADLLAALEAAALVLDSDFAEEAGRNGFVQQRALALDAANDPEATDEAAAAAAASLLAVMPEADLAPQVTGLELAAVSDTLGVGKSMALQTLAVYDRGARENVTEAAEYTAEGAVSVDETGLVTANVAGSGVVTAAYGGQTAQLEVTAVQDPNGVLFVTGGAGGRISRSADGPYVPGEAVQLTAEAEPGFLFTQWNVNGEGITEPAITAVAGRDTYVEAMFTKETTVTLTLSGEEAVTVDDDQLVYTVSGSNMLRLATAIITVELDETRISEPVAQGLGGWQVMYQSYSEGVLMVAVFHLEGMDGSGEIFSITGDLSGDPGSVRSALETAVLSAYEGDAECFVDVILDGEVVTEIRHSIFDVNRDGVVDQLDVTRCQRWYGSNSPICDVDQSGEVEINDIILILTYYYI